MKYKIIEKAWKVNPKNLSEPYFYNDIIVRATTVGKAKKLAYNELEEMGASTYSNGDLKYTDVILNRYPDADLVDFNGTPVVKSSIKGRLWCLDRDAKARTLKDEFPDALAVVWAGVYGGWWGKNRSGYTSDLSRAGTYTTDEAYNIVRGSDYGRQEKVELFDPVKVNASLEERISKKHAEIKELTGEIQELEKRKII